MRSYNDGIERAHLVGPKGEEIIKILIKYAEIKDPAIYRKMSVNACDPDGRLDLPSLKFDLEVFRKEGLIEAPVELSDALDTSFLEAAVKQLGPYVPNK
jgi:NitT/TauT family transport system substrate-binding protein